jgi:hypothetical protein
MKTNLWYIKLFDVFMILLNFYQDMHNIQIIFYFYLDYKDLSSSMIIKIEGLCNYFYEKSDHNPNDLQYQA